MNDWPSFVVGVAVGLAAAYVVSLVVVFLCYRWSRLR